MSLWEGLLSAEDVIYSFKCSNGSAHINLSGRQRPRPSAATASQRVSGCGPHGPWRCEAGRPGTARASGGDGRGFWPAASCEADRIVAIGRRWHLRLLSPCAIQVACSARVPALSQHGRGSGTAPKCELVAANCSSQIQIPFHAMRANEEGGGPYLVCV